MSNHQKRLSVPDSWPVERKTATFTVKADAGPHGEAGVPLLVLLRDVLGYVDTKKEARYALNQDGVLVNGEAESDEERPIGMFDIVAFPDREEHYRVFPDEGGRLALTPIDAADADSKLGRIVNKTQVPGGETQLTFHDGRTMLTEESYGVGDSLVIDADGEVVAHFAYEEGALVTAIRGAHAGEIGRIDEIQVTPGSAANNVVVDRAVDGGSGEGSFETVEEYVVVIDENFVDEETVSTTDLEGETAADAAAAEGEADDEPEDEEAES